MSIWKEVIQKFKNSQNLANDDRVVNPRMNLFLTLAALQFIEQFSNKTI